MFDYVKKSLLTGVGMALRSKSEIRELAEELAKSTQMSQAEAKDFLEECQHRYEDARVKLDRRMEETVEKILKRLDLPTRSDIRDLNTRIDDLVKKIEARD
ncbi:MAG: phasin family protein [Desulfotignum sp.]|nr:phasin family protein [Desulfotignum sp.]MCF8088089.1 phasin family protein [Desulfotignum sp.]MCF8136590.1 phasin family protein [Desulfotignum sp.]